MNSTSTTLEPSKDIEFASRLSDMQQLGWRDAIHEDHVLLRLANPSAEALEIIKQRFSLDDLHLKDLQNPKHPPQMSCLEQDVIHLILRFPISSDSGDGEITSVSIVADDKLCALIWPVKRFHHFPARDLLGLTIHGCISKMIHILVDYLLTRVYTLREEMDELEDECLSDVNNADLVSLLAKRKEMAELARHGRNNALAIEKLRLGSDFADDLRLIDAHEHMNRATAIADAKAEHALTVMQAAQSLLSQRLNEVMAFLAVITVVLTPMGIVAGIFGMNFTHMDVLSHPHGFIWSIWGMLLLGAILAAFFKFKKWW